MRLHEGVHERLIEKLTASNLERQLSLLRDLVEVCIAIPGQRIDTQMIKWLHAHVTSGLVDAPGHYRDHDLKLRGTGFEPPHHGEVADLMGQFVPELHRQWQGSTDLFVLAAFALWTLCWIHPFEDGNGRTARAVSYLIVCVKLGGWLPGRRTLLERIKLDSEEYRAALRHADLSFASGSVDLLPLANLLSSHTLDQLLDS